MISCSLDAPMRVVIVDTDGKTHVIDAVSLRFEGAAAHRPPTAQPSLLPSSAPEEPRPVEPMTPPPGADEVLAGIWDRPKLSAGEASRLMLSMLDLWRRTWGMKTATATAPRRKEWATWMRDKVPPSIIAKAIIGMTFDTSPADRDVHHEWNLVARNLDGFASLYDAAKRDGRKPVWPKAPEDKPIPGCKLWRGIWVPLHYIPGQTDMERIGEGTQVFIIETCTWSDPGWPQGRATIAKQDAKYGRPVNAPKFSRPPTHS